MIMRMPNENLKATNIFLKKNNHETIYNTAFGFRFDDLLRTI